MKSRFLLPVVGALFCGYGVQQEGQEAALQAKVDALEARIATIETYLQSQARVAQSFGQTVDQAVEKGYTAGINYESRELLVAAWRKQVAAATSGVPGAKKDAQAEKVDPRVVRRGQGGR